MPCGQQMMMPMNDMMAENYDPSMPVCNNQDDFNMAFRKAIKYNNKESMKKAKGWMYIYLGLWALFFIWGVLLAMSVPAGSERTIHLVFAMLFGPAYVLAHYLGDMSKGYGGMGGSFGMCGRR